MSVPQAFYAAYLRQDRVWPSTSAGADVEISAMHPAQAINSFHRLVAGMDDASAPVNRGVYSCPLAMALLEQAVGEKVIFEADIEEPQFAPASTDFSLEECFDVLAELKALDELHPDAHPITRAKFLLSRLDRIQKGEPT